MKIEKIQRGIVNYIDEEVVPHIREGITVGSGAFAVQIPASLKRVAIGAAGAVLAKKASGYVVSLFDPDGSGEVDLEEVKNELVSRMADGSIPIKIGDAFEMRLTKNDINDLYRYITEA